jgi:hypothetical protein
MNILESIFSSLKNEKYAALLQHQGNLICFNERIYCYQKSKYLDCIDEPFLLIEIHKPGSQIPKEVDGATNSVQAHGRLVDEKHSIVIQILLDGNPYWVRTVHYHLRLVCVTK